MQIGTKVYMWLKIIKEYAKTNLLKEEKKYERVNSFNCAIYLKVNFLIYKINLDLIIDYI